MGASKPWHEMVEDIRMAVDEERYELTAWEEKFLQSIDDIITGVNPLAITFNQDSALERIWEKLPPF